MSASNPARTEPTEIAGRFQVVQKLGAGAFGTVYKAKDKVLGRMLAIKTIRLEGLAASQTGLAEMLERFQREARVAAQLKHPNIVTIYDIGDSDGLSYISMEFIDGVGIDTVIAQSGRLPIERAAALAAQVADGLDYAHRHGVVHRDIKPANIMVEPGDRVKVTDFGIAKPGDSAEHLTMTGSLLGTPSYMSPEQARGQKLDGRSDLFSLGCVIYEMLAGRKAFRGDSITALLFKIITEEPPALHELDPTVPDGMIRLLEKALAKSPEARYQSGREMAEDLLALTRPTSVPTMRSTDVPTVAQESAPTIASAATVVAPQTVASGAGAGAATAATASSAGSQAPVGATVLTSPPAPAATVLQPAAEAARPRPAMPARVAPTRSSGPSPILVLALLGFGMLVLLVVAGSGWWYFRSRSAATLTTEASTPPTLASPFAAPSDATPEPTPTEAAGNPNGGQAEVASPVTPTPTPEASTGSTPARTATDAGPGQGVRAPSGQALPPAGPPPGSQASSGARTDYSYLNEVPAEGSDGRGLGDAAARSYRSGNSGSSSGVEGRRYAARPRVPRDVGPSERPAVATLLHVGFAQQAFHRANGRYGSLQELRAAGILRLDVPLQNASFERTQYRFELLAFSGDEYKVTATPLANGRPFYTDDNGFVLVDR